MYTHSWYGGTLCAIFHIFNLISIMLWGFHLLTVHASSGVSLGRHKPVWFFQWSYYILKTLICACISINIIQWNCEWIIVSVIVYLVFFYYLDNRSNSRANTCINSQTHERVVFIRYKPTLFGFALVIHNTSDNHMTLCQI